MKVVRSKGTIFPSDRILEILRGVGEKGLTSRDLGRLLKQEPAQLAPHIARLCHQGLVRSCWIPFKGGQGSDPLQIAWYTAIRPLESPDLAPIPSKPPSTKVEDPICA